MYIIGEVVVHTGEVIIDIISLIKYNEFEVIVMTKKKRETTIVQAILEGSLNEEHIIQKSRPLLRMKKSPFSLGELKVLDTYLSRINSHDENCRTVKFTKEEYEDLMGIERMHPKRLEKYVDCLMSQSVTLPHEQSPEGWRKYNLFAYSECYQDKYKVWCINLSCTEQARELFFNIDKIGYLRYKLSNILPLTSKYSVFLYMYLRDNRYRDNWFVSVEELRDILQCRDVVSYQEFKIFKREVLNKALKEVNAKTDIDFKLSTTAKGCKAGREVINVEFTLVKDDTDAQQLALMDKQTQRKQGIQEVREEQELAVNREKYNDAEYPDPDMLILANICGNEFSVEEMAVLMKALVLRKFSDDEWETRGKYLDLCVAKMNRYAAKKPILNRFEYLQTIIEKDKKDYSTPTNTETVKKYKSRFCNFEGRKVDYNEIERLEQEYITRLLEEKKGA